MKYIKKKKKIRFFTCEGDNYQIGYTIGKKTKDKINFFLNLKKEIINDKKIDNLSKKFLNICKRNYPQYLTELQGMADGSNQKFVDLFKFNLTKLERNLKNENCTTVIFKKKNKILIGHNEDLSGNDIFLTKIKLKDKTKILAVCYYGTLPGISASLNSYGFMQTLNFLASKDNKLGVPLIFLSRANIESKNIKEAVDRITKVKRAKGENFIFCQKNKFVNIETTATKHTVLLPSNSFVHTNHYLNKELLPYEAKKNLSNSLSRFVQAKTLIKIYKKKSFKTLKKILSSHYDPPNTICRHTKKFNDYNHTAGTILIDSTKKEMKICYGNPCQSKFYTYKL